MTNSHAEGTTGAPGLVYIPVPVEHAATVAVDPVCGAAVEIETMAGELFHEGETYRFCSLACAGRFATDPSRFASAGEGGAVRTG